MNSLKHLLVLGAITTAAAKRHHASDNGDDNNWCGAVEQTAVTYVEGTWKVPSASLPPNGDSSLFYGNSQWVGIDGYGSGCGLFQAGTSSYVSSTIVTPVYYNLNESCNSWLTVKCITRLKTAKSATIRGWNGTPMTP